MPRAALNAQDPAPPRSPAGARGSPSGSRRTDALPHGAVTVAEPKRPRLAGRGCSQSTRKSLPPAPSRAGVPIAHSAGEPAVVLDSAASVLRTGQLGSQRRPRRSPHSLVPAGEAPKGAAAGSPRSGSQTASGG